MNVQLPLNHNFFFAAPKQMSKEELQDYLGPDQIMEMLKTEVNASSEDSVSFRLSSELV